MVKCAERQTRFGFRVFPAMYILLSTPPLAAFPTLVHSSIPHYLYRTYRNSYVSLGCLIPPPLSNFPLVGLRARDRQRAACRGQTVLEALHLPLDQLRAVRGAAG